MQIRYIADTHLYDNYSWEWRTKYDGFDAYAEDLIRKWNETVRNDDDLTIHVGDIGTYCPRTLEVLRELRGRKALILGNHDINWEDKVYTCGIFQGVYSIFRMDNLVLCHNPDTQHLDNEYLIHGHHHGYDTFNMQKALIAYLQDTYRLNCAADLIGNRPLTLNELIICKEDMILSRR